MDAGQPVKHPRQLEHAIEVGYRATFGRQFLRRMSADGALYLLDYGARHDALVRVVECAALQTHGRTRTQISGVVVEQGSRSHIYLREGMPLWDAFSTVGHELGHILFEEPVEEVDDEAMAYAFEIAWCEALVRARIPGGRTALAAARRIPCAIHDAHDRAKRYAASLAHEGADMLAVAYAISRGDVRVHDSPCNLDSKSRVTTAKQTCNAT